MLNDSLASTRCGQYIFLIAHRHEPLWQRWPQAMHRQQPSSWMAGLLQEPLNA